MRSTVVAGLMGVIVGAAGSQAARAADATPRTSETVTVEAAVPSSRAAKVASFVAVHTQLSLSRQLSRWQSPVCPAAIGLPAGFASFISARVRAVAQEIGIPIAAAGCSANIMIVATPDPQKLLDDVADHRHQLLGVYFLPDEEQVKAVRWPIQAWHMTATRSRDGIPTLDDAYRPTAPGQPGSRLSPGRSSMLANVLIVIDLKTLGGREIGPLADYIAMLALSQAAVTDDCSPIPTILDLFARNCPDTSKATALTAADRSFLTALYRTDRDALGWVERSQVLNAMLADTKLP